MRGLDVSEVRTAVEKTAGLLTAEVKSVEQAKQLENPDTVVMFHDVEYQTLLSKVATINYGSKPGQTDRVVRYFWEFDEISSQWQLLESTPSGKGLFTGKEKVCLSLKEVENQKIKEFGIRSPDIWGKQGIIQSLMREMPFSIYCGNIFDNNTSVLHIAESEDLSAVLYFMESGEYIKKIRKLNQKLDVAAHTMVKVPFDLAQWTKTAKEIYPNGLPKPYSDDPTQWIFHGHPCGSVVWDEEKKRLEVASTLRTDSTVLQVAVARLLGYRWPAESRSGILPLESDEKRQDGASTMELAYEHREWVKRCEELLPFADEDGIVCIPPVRGEMKAEDRLENLLAAAYGSEWSSNKKAELLAQAGHAGKTLETWLRDKFFTQHCKLFHHRPFIWHIWDGLHDGFAAMVNYHKLDAKLLETLIYNYLGDWISRCKVEAASSRLYQRQDAAATINPQEKLAAAEALKKKLELILEGEGYPDKENPEKSYGYDIFVRWKSIEKQSIGWNPDLNDGVRLNIRPFMTVLDVGKKGAGILRDKPNIKWTKDRGKDVESAPWYHLGPIHDGNEGDRINDHHLTLEEKRKAREQIK